MKNLWPEKFEENTKPSAKLVLEEQAKLLVTITEGIVTAEVVEMSALDALNADLDTDEFAYSFNLVGKFIKNYRFRVLSFSHDITLYPVTFKLDEQLAKEIGVERMGVGGYKATVAEPAELESFLGIVLSSKRVANVVGSILKLSK